MRKEFLFSFLLFIFLSPNFVFASNFFFDDFENYQLGCLDGQNGWEVPAENWFVTNENCFEAKKCIKIEKASYNGYARKFISKPPFSKEYLIEGKLKFYFYFSGENFEGFHVYLMGRGNYGSITHANLLRGFSDNSLRHYAGSGNYTIVFPEISLDN